MNKSSKTNQQLLLEVEELRTRLDVAQQRLQEANGQVQAEMTKLKGTEQVLEERPAPFGGGGSLRNPQP